MPSAEETTYLIEVMPDASLSEESFTSRDVDVLVSRIKENLRLSGLKSRSSLAVSHKMRASPYRLPSRCSWTEPGSCCDLCSSKRHNSTSSEPDQPTHSLQPQSQTEQANGIINNNNNNNNNSINNNSNNSTSGHQQQHHLQHYRRCRKAAALVRSELDSYERFQALLRKGALIKEAVKRLQNPEDEEEDEEDEDVDSDLQNDLYCRRRRALRTVEPLPAVYQPLDL